MRIFTLVALHCNIKKYESPPLKIEYIMLNIYFTGFKFILIIVSGVFKPRRGFSKISPHTFRPKPKLVIPLYEIYFF